MRKIIVLVIFSLLITTCVSANPINTVSRAQAEQDLKSALIDKYAPHYSLIETLYVSNMEDYDKLSRVPESNLSNKILQDLKNRYYPHFGLIYILYKSNMDSAKRFQQ